MSRGNCTNPRENFRFRQEELAKKEFQSFLDSMVECADCGFGFTPGEDGGSTLCDDCIENHQFWREIEDEKHDTKNISQ